MPLAKTLVALPCHLAPGAFSGERVFSVRMANGHEYVSLAPRQFCWNQSGQLVDRHEPGNAAEGMVAARVVNEPDALQVFVEVPDGEVIAVDRELVRSRPTEIRPPVPPTWN